MEDVAKYEMADGQIRAQYMIANQTTMDTKIVLRKAGYTGAGYREQYEGKATGTYPIYRNDTLLGKRTLGKKSGDSRIVL